MFNELPSLISCAMYRFINNNRITNNFVSLLYIVRTTSVAVCFYILLIMFHNLVGKLYLQSFIHNIMSNK